MDKSIHGLDDFRMPLIDLFNIVADLIDEHGENAIVYTDAGYNNVSVMLHIPEKAPASLGPSKAQLARKAMEKLAKETQKKASKTDDLAMQGMYLKDAGDYLQIAGSLKSGHLDRAAERAFRLDTAARDEIPQTTWQYLLSIAEKDK